MADELTRIDEWIVDTLTADTTLTALIGGPAPRIYSDVVPQDGAFPCVRFDYATGRDVRGGTLASTRIMVNALYIVRGIAQQKSYGGDLRTIADRIDANLKASSGGPAGDDGVVFSAVREEPFRMNEPVDGVQWRHLGGIYRINAQVA